MRKLLLLLLVAPCFAQYQGNLPGAIDSSHDGSPVNTQGVIAWPENVATNDTIVCGIVVRHTDVYTISDSLGNTWNSSSPTNTGGSGPVDNWMSYTKSGSAGADTITLTPVGTPLDRPFLHCARLSNLGALDGSVATATAAAPAGVGSINTSVTTAVNNDTIINFSAGAWFGTHYDLPDGATTELLAQNNAASPSFQGLLSITHAGAKGTYTPTHLTWGGSSNRAMQSMAFKPALAAASSSIFIADSGALPDAGNGVSYSAQLHCIGGTATQSYTLSGGSLPSGITLTGASGLISGSSTATGNYSPQFTCTDGTVTSSAAALTLQVSSTVLGIPTIRQTLKNWSGDNGGGSININVACGSYLVFYVRGVDTHGSAGWLSAVSGTNNYIKDSFGSTVRRMPSPFGGPFAWAGATYVIGPITHSGTDTISGFNNQSASSGRTQSLIIEVTGANYYDNGTATDLLTISSSGSLSANYTTVVPNTMIIAVGDGAYTESLDSAYAVLSSDSDIEGTTIYGQQTVSSASTITSTLSFSGNSGLSPTGYSIVNIPLRPAIQLSTCPAIFGAGEKIRRWGF